MGGKYGFPNTMGAARRTQNFTNPPTELIVVHCVDTPGQFKNFGMQFRIGL